MRVSLSWNDESPVIRSLLGASAFLQTPNPTLHYSTPGLVILSQGRLSAYAVVLVMHPSTRPPVAHAVQSECVGVTIALRFLAMTCAITLPQSRSDPSSPYSESYVRDTGV